MPNDGYTIGVGQDFATIADFLNRDPNVYPLTIGYLTDSSYVGSNNVSAGSSGGTIKIDPNNNSSQIVIKADPNAAENILDIATANQIVFEGEGRIVFENVLTSGFVPFYLRAGSNLVLNNVKYTGIYEPPYGTVFWVEGATLSISGSEFTSPVSSTNGSTLLYFATGTNSVTVTDTAFTATYSAAASYPSRFIYVAGGSLSGRATKNKLSCATVYSQSGAGTGFSFQLDNCLINVPDSYSGTDDVITILQPAGEVVVSELTCIGTTNASQKCVSATTEGPHVKNTIIHTFATGVSGNNTSVTDYCCIFNCTTTYSNATPGANDIFSDPQILDFATGEISAGSPCVDIGVSTGTGYDIRGVSRPQGSAYDIGCWEVVTTVPRRTLKYSSMGELVGRCPVEFGTSPANSGDGFVQPSGTRFFAYGEPVTSYAINRGLAALAENVDTLRNFFSRHRGFLVVETVSITVNDPTNPTSAYLHLPSNFYKVPADVADVSKWFILLNPITGDFLRDSNRNKITVADIAQANISGVYGPVYDQTGPFIRDSVRGSNHQIVQLTRYSVVVNEDLSAALGIAVSDFAGLVAFISGYQNKYAFVDGYYVILKADIEGSQTTLYLGSKLAESNEDLNNLAFSSFNDVLSLYELSSFDLLQYDEADEPLTHGVVSIYTIENEVLQPRLQLTAVPEDISAQVAVVCLKASSDPENASQATDFVDLLNKAANSGYYATLASSASSLTLPYTSRAVVVDKQFGVGEVAAGADWTLTIAGAPSGYWTVTLANVDAANPIDVSQVWVKAINESAGTVTIHFGAAPDSGTLRITINFGVGGPT